MAPAPGTTAPTSVRHTERLTVPWWLALAGLAVAVGIAAELHLGAPGLRSWISYAVTVPVAVLALWYLGRIRVAVVDGELLVDDARLPLRFVSGARVVDAATRRELLGVHAHPWAFTVQRPWIGGTVVVVLDDPDDPTPYWLVSSRHPEALVTAIDRERDRLAVDHRAP